MKNLAGQNEDSDLCRHYRKKVYEVFAELDDPLVTGLWNARYLCGKRVDEKK
jgi:hypothetical protein